MTESRDARLLTIGGWSLCAKISAVILVGILLGGAVILVVGLISAGGAARSQVQAKFALAATSKMRSAVDSLSESLTLLRGIAADPVVIAACEAANTGYDTGADISIDELNPRWLRADGDSQLVLSIISPALNPATAQLRRHTAGLPQYAQVSVMDGMGVAIASTRRPDLQYLGNATWWAALQSEELGRQHVDIYQPLGSPDAYRYVEIAVPIYRDAGTQEDVIGVVYARTHIAPLIEAIQGSNPSDAAQTLVLDESGRAIVATEGSLVGSVADTSWWQRQFIQSQHRRFHEARMLDGTSVLLGYATMSVLDPQRTSTSVTFSTLGWILYVYEPTGSAYAAARQDTRALWMWGGGGLLVAAMLGLTLAGALARPLQRVVDFAERAGDATVTDRARIHPSREAGALARALNGLLDERDALRRAVAAGDERGEVARARRLRDAEVAVSVGDLVAESTDVAVLAQQSADLIREQYGLYYVGLYLVDAASRWAVLLAGTGETGRELLSQAHRIAVGSGVVGVCAASGRVEIDRDLDTVRDGDEENLLPYARAEMAVPLRSRGVVIGVLVADSYQPETFDDEMVVTLRLIADQVAAAVDGLRLFAESRTATERLQRVYGELTRESWQEALSGQVGRGYEALPSGVQALDSQPTESWPTYQRDAWTTRRTIVARALDRAGVATRRCVIPILIRDEAIGVLDVSKLEAHGEWTQSELDELEGLAEQLGQALENARLYEAAQRNALEEQMVGGVTRRMRETLNVDHVLQTAVQELRTLLNVEGVEIRVGPGDTQVK